MSSNPRSKSLGRRPIKNISNPTTNIKRRHSTSVVSQSKQQPNKQQQQTKEFNCFDKFIKYLVSFNKLEENARKKLQRDNPRKNYDGTNYRINIPINILEKLCLKTFQLFSDEPNMLNLSSNIHIFGDIHGQYCDLIRFIDMIGLPPKVKFLFLGDYVDRGDNSIEVISLLFSLKIKYPKQVFLLRGNHECPLLNDAYGFKEECVERYKEKGEYIWREINKTLRMLPICALIEKKIFATHGGISPHISSFKQINELNRNVDIPDKGIICDLTWSDPKKQKSKWDDNDRGISYTFNENALNDFMKKLNLDLVVRAHQVVDEGFQFFNGQKMVTVFSAPNYCGQVGNLASVMLIKKNMECSFITLKPVRKKIKKQYSFSISKQ